MNTKAQINKQIVGWYNGSALIVGNLIKLRCAGSSPAPIARKQLNENLIFNAKADYD